MAYIKKQWQAAGRGEPGTSQGGEVAHEGWHANLAHEAHELWLAYSSKQSQSKQQGDALAAC